MDSIFTWLSTLVQSTFLLAVAGSFIWGILSILLSPCHLAGIPLIVAYISQQENKSTKNAFFTSLSFSTGILITIALIGLVTSLMGRMLGDIGRLGNYFVAAVFFLVGLYLLDIIKINFPGAGQLNIKKKGAGPAFILGLIFGIALGPCTFAFMAPVLAISLFSSSSNFIHSFSILAAYGAGHCLVITLAGTFTGYIKKYLKWNESSRGIVIAKRICGVLIIAAGIYLIIN
ncbi:MAG: cytochrome c biogenesis protein CcdA [Acidobacteriota bacterium]